VCKIEVHLFVEASEARARLYLHSYELLYFVRESEKLNPP
jgi:hypothetical protein